jgi:hypothetical protein
MISGGFIELPSAETRDYYRWINRRPLVVAPQWLIDRLAALAASKTTKGNDGMGAGATAVGAFRKGQLLDRPLPMIVADQQELGSIDVPDKIHDDQEDKKDRSEIVHQAHRRSPRLQPARSRSILLWWSERRERMLSRQILLDMTKPLIGSGQMTLLK